MIGSSHSQLFRKNSCSVKLQGRALGHNPRKIPVEGSWIIILQNNSKCLLLNDKQIPHEILFSLLGEIQNKKLKERKFEKKSKRYSVGCFNICVVVFPFMFSTLEEGVSRNFRFVPVIHSGYDMILYLFQTDRCCLLSFEKFFSLLCSTLSPSFRIDIFNNFSFIVFWFYV